MKQAICSFIYHKILGWKAEVSVPDFDKCIIPSHHELGPVYRQAVYQCHRS